MSYIRVRNLMLAGAVLAIVLLFVSRHVEQALLQHAVEASLVQH